MTKSAINEVSMQENLLTADQVAHYLKVDKFTVYRLVSQKKIPAFKVGSQWRFKRRMIDAWLLKNSNLDKNGRE
jgi:excisionase family DNA binding protein